MKSNQKGFGITVLLIVVAVMAIVGAGGWLVYENNFNSQSDTDLSARDSGNESSSAKTNSIATEENPAANQDSGSTSSTELQPVQTKSYDEYLNITEWGIRIPTDSKYMGYRSDISDATNNLVSVFITDIDDGLSREVGCASGNVQGVFVTKDKKYTDLTSDNGTMMPHADLYLANHTYYIYKSICNGSGATSEVESLANKVSKMGLN